MVAAGLARWPDWRSSLAGVVWFTRSDACANPVSAVRAAKLLVTQPDLGENSALGRNQVV